MPAASEAQRKAMWAAASGKGNLGIPEKVAKEFTEADPGGKLPAKAKDMAPTRWDAFKKLFMEFLDEERKEPEHAEDDSWPGAEDDWSPEAREAAAKARQAKAHLHVTATPAGGGKAAFKTKAGSHAEVEQHLANLHKHVKSAKLGEHRVSIHNTENGEVHHASVHEHGITGRSFAKNSFDEARTAKDDLETTPNGGIPTAASILFGTPTGRVLFVKRAKTEENWPDTWSLPGGKADDDEDAAACAVREAKEEVGRDCATDDLNEVESKETPYGWRHVLYAHQVDDEFEPKLNGEHSEHVWAPIDEPPEPLHPGLKASLEALRAKAAVAKDDGEEEETAEDAVEHDPKNGQFTSKVTGSVGGTRHIETKPGSGKYVPLGAHSVHKWEQGREEHLGNIVYHSNNQKQADRHARKLTEKTGDPHTVRHTQYLRYPSGTKDQAHDALLGPYPVRTQRDGVWAYDAALLATTARRARLAGRGDIARRAEAIRAREFPAQAQDEVITIEANDQDGQLSGLLDYIKKTAGIGHSFEVVVDPDDSEYRKKFFFDGDGAFRIKTLKGDTEHKTNITSDVFAFDHDSVRRSDADGRLHVDVANISRANICDYTGDEINEVMRDKPGWKMLEPGRRYKLLRDPEELKKAVDSFNNLPILDRHVPVSADNHKPEHVIGSTGTDATFDGDHLKNSLVVWSRPAIDKIESGESAELSAAYRYLAEMKPGIYKGEPYEGRMTGIVANHLASVKKGRAGPTVAIGDEAIPEDRDWQLLERAIRHDANRRAPAQIQDPKGRAVRPGLRRSAA